MVKRGKLGKEMRSKRKTLKGSMSKGFNKVIKGSRKKKVIIGGVLISVLSLSIVGYFQSKSALASNYKSLKITEKAENINRITAYNKITEGEEINVLLLGDESYLGDVVLNDDVTSFIEDNYSSKVNLIDLSIDDASIYEQLNEYINLEGREFDLVFLCVDNSDEKEISKTNFSGIYESILRDLKYNNTAVDIVPIIKHNTIVNDTYYQIINALSKYYDLELAKVNDVVLSNNLEGETIEDFRESYSNTIINVIKDNIENKKEIDTEYKDVYYGVTTLFEPYKVILKGDKKKGFSVSQDQAKSNTESDYIRYKVEGNIVGLGYETSKNGGIIEVYVNRVLYRRIDTKSESEEIKYTLISSNLTGENEIKVVNNNGGDITLLGVITSGDNKDSKEVENLNNILARNTGNYNGQQKNDLLYEDAKVESNQVVTSEKEEVTPVKVSKDKENTAQSKSSINTQNKPSTQGNSVSVDNTNNVPSNDIVEETKPIENNQSNGTINNEGGGNVNLGNNEGVNEGDNTAGNSQGNIAGGTNNGAGSGQNNSVNNGMNNSGDSGNNTENNIGGGNAENNNANNVVNNESNAGNNVGGSGNNTAENVTNNNGNTSGNTAVDNNASNNQNNVSNNQVVTGGGQSSSNTNNFQPEENVTSESISPSE